jgi:hypothetical protein
MPGAFAFHAEDVKQGKNGSYGSYRTNGSYEKLFIGPIIPIAPITPILAVLRAQIETILSRIFDFLRS